jgi:crossover junction endodeoxyribonuclease RuvC
MGREKHSPIWFEMAKAVRILGIDPGLNTTGYAVIESHAGGPKLIEAGILTSDEAKTADNLPNRLKALFDGVLDVITQLHPTVLSVEQLYAHYEHPRTAILMGHARGAILLAGAQHGLPVVSYAATQIKKSITGSGRASKEQMQMAMLREFRLAAMPEPHDVADAMAIALCHFFQDASSNTERRGMGVRLSAFDTE